MSKIDDGGPAFPGTEDISVVNGVSVLSPFPGMSLRDWFAGQVIIGIYAATTHAAHADDAREAYMQADAMIAARKEASA